MKMVEKYWWVIAAAVVAGLVSYPNNPKRYAEMRRNFIHHAIAEAFSEHFAKEVAEAECEKLFLAPSWTEDLSEHDLSALVFECHDLLIDRPLKIPT